MATIAEGLPTPARHLTHNAVMTHADLIRGGYWQSCKLWYVNFSKAKFLCSSAIVFADLMCISRSCPFWAPTKHENRLESNYHRVACAGRRLILLGAE
jgi:hypothetical protein